MNKLAVIKLTGKRGGYTLVDRADYDRFNRYKWNLRSHGYVARGDYVPETQETQIVYLHRLINQTPSGVKTDHVNRIRTDNTRANLRSCTDCQSSRNLTKRANTTSRFKGVHWDSRFKKWKSYIHCKEAQKTASAICVGTFDTEEAAARAYNEAAKKYHGEFASLNDL